MTAPDAGERFAAHLGVRVATGEGQPCGCWATATLAEPGTWLAAGTDGGRQRTGEGHGAPVPTGALLALIDATARAAAEAALAEPGRQATLVPTGAAVQYRDAGTGTVTASASVPCEGALADRADEAGGLRFSVAVEVVDARGGRVAAGTVHWRASLAPAQDHGDSSGADSGTGPRDTGPRDTGPDTGTAGAGTGRG